MKIVIEISECAYNYIKANGARIPYYKLTDAIKKGTPLPMVHGRLIDADELYGDFIDGTEGYDCNTWNRIEIGDIIDNAPTIIEGSESE